MTHPIQAVRRAATALAVVAMTLGVPAVAAATDSGGLGGIGLRPVNLAQTDPATHSYFMPRLRPGGVLTEQAVVSNSGPNRVDLIVSAVDGRTGTTSGAVYANRQDPVRRAGRWVTPGVGRVSVAGHHDVKVSFTVRVPKGASAGDHLAGLAVENVNPTSTGGRFAIRQVLRSVIGIDVSVPGKAQFQPKLSSLAIGRLPGPDVAAVMVGMDDKGLAVGKPQLSVTLDGPAGYHLMLSRTLDTLLPKDPIVYPFAWRDTLPAGTYQISATITGGGRISSLTRTMAVGAELKGVSVGSKPSAAPLPGGIGLPRLAGLLAGAVLIGIAAGVGIPTWIRRRNSRRAGLPHWPRRRFRT
jgi:hypothetical protein